MRHQLLKLLITSSLFFVSHANASSLIINSAHYNYDLPQSITDKCYETSEDNCPTIDIDYLHSNHSWINNEINQYINEILTGKDHLLPKIHDDEGFWLAQAPAEVKQELDSFVLDFADMSPYIQHSINPTYQGHADNLELFSVGGYTYSGGAHGLGFVNYLVFDGDTKQRLTLDDLLIKGKKSKSALSNLVYNEFITYLQQQDIDVTEHLEYWDFALTDNFTFTDKGLTFLYQPYEITPYAMAMPEFSIDYDKLSGIVKPKYINIGNSI